MEEKVLSMHLDLNEGEQLSVISSEAIILDGEAKLYLNVSWDSAFADELNIEINESSVSAIITSDMPDAAKLLKTRQSGIMFDNIDAALGSKYGRVYRQLIRLLCTAIRNTSAFNKADPLPNWYVPAF